MKYLCIILIRTFAAAVVLSQLVLFAAEKAGFSSLGSSYSRMIIFISSLTAVVAIDVIINRAPSLPSRKLNRISERSGYTDEFYSVLEDWKKKCEKKGSKTLSSLTMCEFLLTGKRYEECFEALEKINYKKLSRLNRQIYFNIYLYGSVLCGDMKGAERIYAYAEPLLLTATDKTIVSSVKHTLGCYEYAHGRLSKAEDYFKQSLDNSRSDDVRFEDYLGLCLCYIDTGRLIYAKNAVLKAGNIADGKFQRRKLQNIKRLVEDAYRNADY